MAVADSEQDVELLPFGERVLGVEVSERWCTPPGLNSDAQPNRVSTTRFTLVTWIPKSLFVQFHRVANIYFLCISIVVLLDFSPIMWSSTVIPFCCVLFWTCLKDLYEDMRRKRDDDAENFRPTWRWDFDSRKFVSVRWCDVLCGDILLNLQDQPVPADCLVMYAPGGQAHISTVNLDGETNLKERRAGNVLTAVTEVLDDPDGTVRRWSTNDVIASGEKAVKLLAGQGAHARLGMPRAGLTDMEGSVTLKNPSAEAVKAFQDLGLSMPSTINYESFVPRGCVLRNTPFIVSLAAYVGEDTKTRLNCEQTQAKISNMQTYLNRGVQGLVISLFVFNAYAAIWADIEGVENPEEWPEDWPASIVRFLVYWVILYQIVPISLYVSFEVMKLLLGWQINRDPQMVDEKTKTGALARTADLVEEMGQVNFVFSDKTGTLTENEMVFARCCISGEDMGDYRAARNGTSSQSLKSAAAGVTPPGVEKARSILADPLNRLHRDLWWFYLCMAACHTVQVEAAPNSNEMVFAGSSPDEVAFLEAAAEVGVHFRSRKRIPGKSGWALVIDGPPAIGKITFEVCAEIAFNSDRKRMTVIGKLQDEVIAIVKGADNVMQPLCCERYSQADNAALTSYSKMGLRTLVFAKKTLNPSFFAQWHNRFSQAELSDEAVATLATEVEHSLTLVGVSAIEDKLQEGVAEAIQVIKEAGIRFWVLTGDKTETAIEIVRSCNLFTDEMTLARLTECTSQEDAIELLERAKKALSDIENGGLVIDGTFVTHVLLTDAGPKLLYELAMRSKACVCCRLSPQQKRRLVELVKVQNIRGITLAIGDGANDVSMLQGAHVGIGIRGKEGNQAVQASDVAISQFRFLVPLLLCHGRRAYRRVAVFLCYVLYKHIVLAMGDVIWAHQCSRRFSGQIAYPEWMSSAFPAVISGLPVIIALGFDQDLPDDVVEQYPQVYLEGIERMHFNSRVFVTWMLTAVWHGAVVWLVPSLWVGSDSWTSHTEPYEPTDFWRSSCISFIMVVVFIDVRLWLYTYSPFAWQTVAILAFSFTATIVCLLGLAFTPPGNAMQPQIENGVVGEIFTEWKYWQVMLVTPLFLVFDVLFIFGMQSLRPSPLADARRRFRTEERTAAKSE